MMRKTLQWILQRIILLIKKVSGWQGILVSGLLIKAVRNNDITKWGHFDKIKTLSEKINDPSPPKKDFAWFNHDSFFGQQTKSVFGRKTEAGKSTRNKNSQMLQHKKYEKRSNNVWRLRRAIFEQKNKT